MSCIRSCYEKDSPNFGHEDCGTCIHGDRQPQQKQEPVTADEKLARMKSELAYMRQAQKQEPVADTHDFIAKTNREYADWCATYYQPESLDERGFMSLHGLWAWQEQERRKTSQSQRQPLTDEQIADIVVEMNGNEPTGLFWRDLTRAIEAAHGIKE